ncbi:MAG: helix-turn-helix domain-containing protein [Synechococcus lacustris]
MSATDPSADLISLASLGGRLRQERLRQQIELNTLARRLHMRPDQIEALETGDRGHWPEQAFAVAQLRRLAEALKLDPDPLVADLRELLSQHPSDQPSTAASAVMRAAERRGNAHVPREEGRRDWISATTPKPKPWLKSLGLLALLGIGVIGATLFLLRPRLQPAGPNPSGQQKQSLAKPSGRTPEKAIEKTSEKPLEKSLPKTLLKSLPKSLSKPLPALQKLSASSLQLSSKETVWLAVRELPSQKRLFQGNLSGTKSFPLGLGLQVRAGRPDLVQVQLNGQAKGPLGQIERIEWVTLKPPTAAPGLAPKP